MTDATYMSVTLWRDERTRFQFISVIQNNTLSNDSFCLVGLGTLKRTLQIRRGAAPDQGNSNLAGGGSWLKGGDLNRDYGAIPILLNY